MRPTVRLGAAGSIGCGLVHSGALRRTRHAFDISETIRLERRVRPKAQIVLKRDPPHLPIGASGVGGASFLGR